LEYVDEMKYEERMRVRKMAFGPPLQKQDEEHFHMEESIYSARALVDLLPRLKIFEIMIKGRIT
jgi:hypothetical protein